MNISLLSLAEFKELSNSDSAIILDTRSKEIFTQGFIPGSIYIGIESKSFLNWAEKVLPQNVELIIVAEKGKEEEVQNKLAETNFKIKGFLEGGFDSWKNADEPIDMIVDIDPDEFAMDIPFDEKMVIVDVRSEEEYNEAHVKDAVNIPLEQLTDPAISSNLEEEDNHYIYCGGGYRSLIGASLLKRQGLHNLRNITGGFSEIKKVEKIPLE